MKKLITACTTVLLLAGVSLNASAEYQAQYWSFWDQSKNTLKTIDHSDWDSLLKNYVVTNHPSGINRFRYADVSKSDRKKLDRYIDSLTSTDPREYRKSVQKAYWINLYNAVVVQQILKNYPVKSLAEVDKGGEKGPWDDTYIKVQGQKLSLNDIEHRILRPIWSDHKIHFALTDGSLGSPNLQPTAYTSQNMKPMLKQAGRDFINHPRGLTLEKNVMHCSKIFKDCRSDFCKSDKSLLKLFAHYAEDRKALYLLGFQGEVQYQTDLALNAP
ncbi:DUF547 domain-containing protein [Porticoccaceae bacterium LTM1]|nr:DUF547 domain-containing protein [Porticoccaceae bacterium LTM1]